MRRFTDEVRKMRSGRRKKTPKITQGELCRRALKKHIQLLKRENERKIKELGKFNQH